MAWGRPVSTASHTLCTQRSASGNELKSSSSAMLGRYMKSMERSFARPGFLLGCCCLGLVGLAVSEHRCLKPKPAVLLVSFRKKQSRVYMLGCGNARSSGGSSGKIVSQFPKPICKKTDVQEECQATARRVSAACLLRLCAWCRPLRVVWLFLLVGFVMHSWECECSGSCCRWFVVVGRLLLEISLLAVPAERGLVAKGDPGFCRC